MKPTKLDQLLTSLDACQAARDWVAKEKHKTLSAAWAACPRGDWMLWMAGKLSGAPESEGRKRLVLAACECARLALPRYEKYYPDDKRPRRCIEAAEAWANGKATNAAAAAYAADAYAADADAYDAAAAAAAYAADADAYAAAAAYAADAYAADAADARAKALAQCADIVRKHYPKPPRKLTA